MFPLWYGYLFFDELNRVIEGVSISSGVVMPSPTPFVLALETRTFVIPVETRTFVIPAETRVFEVL